MKKPYLNQQERVFVFNCLSGKLDFPNDYLLKLYFHGKAKQKLRKALEKFFNPAINFLNKFLNK